MSARVAALEQHECKPPKCAMIVQGHSFLSCPECFSSCTQAAHTTQTRPSNYIGLSIADLTARPTFGDCVPFVPMCLYTRLGFSLSSTQLASRRSWMLLCPAVIMFLFHHFGKQIARSEECGLTTVGHGQNRDMCTPVHVQVLFQQSRNI